MPGLSYDSLMRPGQILKVIKRLQTPASFFQRFLKISPTDVPSMTPDLDTFGYDIYAATRTMSPVSAPNSPPVKVGRKPIATELATVYRMHPSIDFFDNEVFRSRQLGSFGLNTEVDMMGQSYIAMQLAHVKSMLDNSIEWMVAHMLKGGFSLRPAGEGFELCLTNDANAIHTNTYKIPATNQGDIGGIIASGEEWSLSTAPILSHLMKIGVQASRISGWPVKHIIRNGNTAIPLFTNTKLAAVGGTAYRIFDSLTNRAVTDGEPLTSGQYTVVFRALPQYVFHIYNEGYINTQVIPDEDSQIDTANFTKYIPDGYAMILPEPSRDWVGYAVGKEVISENIMANPQLVSGLKIWRTRDIDPSRFEAKFLTKYVPLLNMPKVVYYANVWRTGL
jgi:hypothetical protein